MGPALTRIDDRLLHGQVSMGWAPALGSKLIVISNDKVAGDRWLSGIYTDAAPQGVRLQVLTLKETADRFAELSDESLAVIVLVKTPADAVLLWEMGARPDAVNVGGMHFAEGKRRLLPYLFVDDEDVRALRRLMDWGVTVEAQDLPGGGRHDLGALLE